MNSKRRIFTRQLLTAAGGTALAGSSLARTLLPTPRQTEGPFYPPEPHAESDVDLTLLEGHTEHATGEVILVRGQVTDLNGRPIEGVQVDIWQANHWGRYAHPRDRNTAPLDPHFQGIGITRTDDEGRYGFRTIKPAPYPLDALSSTGYRARHIHFRLAHDNAGRVSTQMYFEGDPLLADDVVMRGTPAERRHLLITSAEIDAESGLPLHRFDLALG